MSDYVHHEMFPLGEDETDYRLVTADHVGIERFNGEEILTVETAALTTLAVAAFRDIAHFLRPGHMKQLAAILDDGEASDNDKSPFGILFHGFPPKIVCVYLICFSIYFIRPPL